jgi:hypothetical protein
VSGSSRIISLPGQAARVQRQPVFGRSGSAGASTPPPDFRTPAVIPPIPPSPRPPVVRAAGRGIGGIGGMFRPKPGRIC